MTTTLLLGGSGFVSGALTRTALHHGHTTYTLTRGTRPLPPGPIPLTADRDNPAQFTAALSPPNAPHFFDHVIDSIAFTPAHAHQLLATFFPENAPPRAAHLTVLSSDFACSPIDRPWQIDESFDRFDTAPYGSNKRAVETILLAAAAARRLPITLIRPTHIYGPGSLLGCLPLHGRDPQLLARLKNNQPLRLLGNGHFLQQPIYIDDLCTLILACPANPLTHGQLYFAAGPDILESRTFYQLIADILNLPITIEEAPITPYLKDHPDHHAFCCHRTYSPAKKIAHHLPLPTTPIKEGLRHHLASLTPPP